jgi:hypothetical protein
MANDKKVIVSSLICPFCRRMRNLKNFKIIKMYSASSSVPSGPPPPSYRRSLTRPRSPTFEHSRSPKRSRRNESVERRQITARPVILIPDWIYKGSVETYLQTFRVKELITAGKHSVSVGSSTKFDEDDDTFIGTYAKLKHVYVFMKTEIKERSSTVRASWLVGSSESEYIQMVTIPPLLSNGAMFISDGSIICTPSEGKLFVSKISGSPVPTQFGNELDAVKHSSYIKGKANIIKKGGYLFVSEFGILDFEYGLHIKDKFKDDLIGILVPSPGKTSYVVNASMSRGRIGIWSYDSVEINEKWTLRWEIQVVLVSNIEDVVYFKWMSPHCLFIVSSASDCYLYNVTENDILDVNSSKRPISPAFTFKDKHVISISDVEEIPFSELEKDVKWMERRNSVLPSLLALSVNGTESTKPGLPRKVLNEVFTFF